MTQLVVVCVVIAAVAWFLVSQRLNATKAQRRQFLQKYAFPVALRLKMRDKHPRLTDDEISEVFEALRQWFALLQANPKTKFGMPSKVVDDAWHEFILLTRQYQRFCESAFGKYLHHEPNVVSHVRARNAKTALSRTLALGAGGAIAGSALSTNLFHIDEKLGIENG
ncbi:MAG: glycine-rich domain-containing protein, partial [Casimicrobium sp.]